MSLVRMATSRWWHRSTRSSRCLQTLIFIAGLVLYNEWLVYYVVLSQCRWPSLDHASADVTLPESDSWPPLRVVVLADLHLPNVMRDNKINNVRREWQIQHSFQTAMAIHKPDAVFVLGDLFASGDQYSPAKFIGQSLRLRKMFSTSEGQQLYFLAGNHDIGRRSWINKTRRFEVAFNAPSVQLIRIRQVSFILLNSMALADDGCNLCRAAEADLQTLVKKLRCAKGELKPCSQDDLFNYTKPILLQHFPMFRPSDGVCLGPDVAPPGSNTHYEENIDVMSREKSDKLVKLIEPRLILDGHKHYSCETEYGGVPERTVAPFSWRCRNQPSFMLLTVSSNNLAMSQCFMPRESTVVGLYALGLIGVVVLLVSASRRGAKNHRTTVRQLEP